MTRWRLCRISRQLDWSKVGGVAYDNKETGVRITHFPVIHCRKGSIAYKLEWNGPSLVFSGGTKPERISIEQAKNGIAVQDCSHTPQSAFGYLLSQIGPRPRLKVATHFPLSDDTVNCAMRSVRNHIPDIGNLGEVLPEASSLHAYQRLESCDLAGQSRPLRHVNDALDALVRAGSLLRDPPQRRAADQDAAGFELRGVAW